MKNLTLSIMMLLWSFSTHAQNCSYTVSASLVAGQPNMIFFTFANASPTATNFTWNFGDGNSSNQPTTFHTYAQPGTYYYCLTIGECTAVCDSIVVIPITGCNSFFASVINNNTVQIYPYNISGQYQAIVDWGDNAIDTFSFATAPNSFIHTYAIAGTYNLCFTHRNTLLDCSNTRCENVTVGSTTTTNVSENVLKLTKFYPNPVVEMLHISLPESAGNTVASIYDMKGSLVKVTQLENRENSLDVLDLQAGMYMLRLQSQKDSYQTKFIKH